MNDDFDLGKTTVRRQEYVPHQLSLLKHIYVERGDISDWKQLEALHYRSSALGIGPRFMRCVLDDGITREVIGVMVFTVPKPLDAGRNEVFPNMKPNQKGMDNTLINRMRMQWLNKHVILSSRTVLDTMYRGAGIAYRMKNIGYRMMGFRFVESRSSMSRFNPFSVKAGMRFVRPKAATALDQGLVFFARNFKSPAYDFQAILEELDAMPEYAKRRVTKELREFYYRHSSMEKSGEKRLLGTTRVDGLAVGYVLKQVMQLVFGATAYAVFENPDWGQELPTRIPLSAFESQKINEPLRLDLL